jgi:hypothetical protein
MDEARSMFMFEFHHGMDLLDLLVPIHSLVRNINYCYNICLMKQTSVPTMPVLHTSVDLSQLLSTFINGVG